RSLAAKGHSECHGGMTALRDIIRKSGARPHPTHDALRKQSEDRVVTISRAQGTLTFPANFMLVAAANLGALCPFPRVIQHSLSAFFSRSTIRRICGSASLPRNSPTLD
ncbi:MAG: ATP-binding protein, partial [Chloroflexi bacterium]|nr:ATP-binding protein [Chloroflexota bacterium]